MGFRLVILWLRKLAAATDTLMQRTSLLYNALFSVILIAGPVCLDAQQTSTSRPASVNGIGIPPVAGVPFTATVVIERDRFMDDGSVITRRTINIIARDSSGRTHNEVRRLEPEYFHGSPELMEVRLYDPQTRLRTTYYPATHLARQQAIPEQSKTASLATPWTSREDLGTDTLNGLEVKGTRRKFVVSAHASGTGKPVEVVERVPVFARAAPDPARASHRSPQRRGFRRSLRNKTGRASSVDVPTSGGLQDGRYDPACRARAGERP